MSTRFVPVVPHSLLESLEVSLRSSGVVEVEYVRVNHSKSGTAVLQDVPTKLDGAQIVAWSHWRMGYYSYLFIAPKRGAME